MEPQPEYDIVAIGTSAGGLTALLDVLAPLPADFPAAVVIVQHVLSRRESLLPELLRRALKMKVHEAAEGDALEEGHVYVGCPDAHLAVAAGHIAYDHSPPVHYSRPSIDVLFRSVAQAYGARAIAIVLCGSNADGSEGVRAIKEAGGLTMAESPEEAQFRIMPAAAIATGCVDHVLPLAKISRLLTELCPAVRA